MTLLLVFLAGVVFGGFFVCAIWRLAERELYRGGMIDLIGVYPTKGGTASADPDATELSGGRSSPPPTHLRLIRDNGSSEVIVPLD